MGDSKKEVAFMPGVTHKPEGQYPHPSPVHALNLDDEADRLVAELKGAGHASRSLAREAGVSLVLMALEGGDAVREHSTAGATSIHVLRGHAAIGSAGQVWDCLPGDVLFFQPDVRHDIAAQEQTVVLLTITGAQA